jgi:hypothetical protein
MKLTTIALGVGIRPWHYLRPRPKRRAERPRIDDGRPRREFSDPQHVTDHRQRDGAKLERKREVHIRRPGRQWRSGQGQDARK